MVLENKGKAEETKSALDQELVFKASMKRNKEVGAKSWTRYPFFGRKRFRFIYRKSN